MAGECNALDGLCEAEFCQILEAYKVPQEPSLLLESFEQYLEAQTTAKGSENFLLGSRKQVASRTTCPFCRLATTLVNMSSTERAQSIAPSCVIHVSSSIDGELQLHLSDEGNLFHLGERITFCDPTGQTGSRTARLIESSRIDPHLVSHWIRKCETTHGSLCQDTKFQPDPEREVPKNIRLIDVNQDCIVQRSWETRYFALSYVWGSKPIPRLSKANICHVSTPGALHRYFALPKTVNDAIKLTAMIGERYLWIDCLCLLQDDVEDMRIGIKSMDLIYETAHASIVAANGPDVESGLPRVQEDGLPSAQHAEIIKPGLELIFFRAFDCRLDRSFYASRGWTLQEQLHSRRMIAFVDDRVYMRCRQEVYSEDRAVDAPSVGEDHFPNFSTIIQESFEMGELTGLENLDYLFEIVRRAQVRNLSKPTDAINAVAGLVERIARRMNMSFLEGLPAQALDLGLLFQHSLDIRWPRRNERRTNFPSWSWAGWYGSIVWYWEKLREPSARAMNTFLSDYTWIRWFCLNDNGLKMLHGSNDMAGIRHDSLVNRFPMLDTELWKPLPRPAIQFSTLLVFYTVLVVLKAVPLTRNDKFTLRLLDADDKACGMIIPDFADHDPTNYPENVIILSEKPPDWTLLSESVDSEAINDTKEIRYWVLLVTWTGSFYERRGIGEINHSCIASSYEPGPQWKEIVLG